MIEWIISSSPSLFRGLQKRVGLNPTSLLVQCKFLLRRFGTPQLGALTRFTAGVSLSPFNFIEGRDKIVDKNIFLLDRPFPATPDFRLFGENVALGRGHI